MIDPSDIYDDEGRLMLVRPSGRLMHVLRVWGSETLCGCRVRAAWKDEVAPASDAWRVTCTRCAAALARVGSMRSTEAGT